MRSEQGDYMVAAGQKDIDGQDWQRVQEVVVSEAH